MARPLNNPDDGIEKAVPLMAAAVLQGGGMTDPDIKDLLKEVLGGLADRRRKEAQMREKLALQAVQSAQEMERQKQEVQGRCSHLKQDGRSTRLAGQYITDGHGRNQLCLVCVFCHKEFHSPAFEGQTPPPHHLIPPADEIGG